MEYKMVQNGINLSQVKPISLQEYKTMTATPNVDLSPKGDEFVHKEDLPAPKINKNDKNNRNKILAIGFGAVSLAVAAFAIFHGIKSHKLLEAFKNDISNKTLKELNDIVPTGKKQTAFLAETIKKRTEALNTFMKGIEEKSLLELENTVGKNADETDALKNLISKRTEQLTELARLEADTEALAKKEESCRKLIGNLELYQQIVGFGDAIESGKITPEQRYTSLFKMQNHIQHLKFNAEKLPAGIKIVDEKYVYSVPEAPLELSKELEPKRISGVVAEAQRQYKAEDRTSYNAKMFDDIKDVVKVLKEKYQMLPIDVKKENLACGISDEEFVTMSEKIKKAFRNAGLFPLYKDDKLLDDVGRSAFNEGNSITHPVPALFVKRGEKLEMLSGMTGMF